MRSIWISLLLASHVVQAQPAKASCKDTLACYLQCNPITEACAASCDQRTTVDTATNAHAVVQCMASSGCKDQNCVAQACSTQLQACTIVVPTQPQQPQPQQPQPQAQTGGIDLDYKIPAGWQELHMITNATTLQLERKQAFSPLEQYRLHIFPSRSYKGSITDVYHQLWNELVAPDFQTKFTQAPVRRRLASGYAVAMDSAFGNLHGVNAYAGLLLVYTDDRVVPIVSTGLQAGAEQQLEQFFDAVKIRGYAASKTALFDAKDLVGSWSTASAATAVYVNGAGQTVGDASVATSATFTLAADGTYRSHAVAVAAAGGAGVDNNNGRWRIDDDTLVLEHGGRTDRKRIWARGTAPKGNPDALCLTSFGTEQPRYFSSSGNTDWYGRAK